VFDGEDASGVWRLSITDDSTSDTGTLFGWTLYAGF
jgi:subtilisin-like proprotein convertase family protein